VLNSCQRTRTTDDGGDRDKDGDGDRDRDMETGTGTGTRNQSSQSAIISVLPGAAVPKSTSIAGFLTTRPPVLCQRGGAKTCFHEALFVLSLPSRWEHLPGSAVVQWCSGGCSSWLPRPTAATTYRISFDVFYLLRTLLTMAIMHPRFIDARSIRQSNRPLRLTLSRPWHLAALVLEVTCSAQYYSVHQP
jgi:hypothetical protein